MFINAKGKLIDVKSPKVMGIINITNDSFYAESRANAETAILKKVEQHLTEGAEFIDIGAQSTRPNATLTDAEIERLRIMESVSSIAKTFPDTIISVDTFRSETAKVAIENGAHIINDISAGMFDANMWQTVAQMRVPYIAMHSSHTFDTMHNVSESINITQHVLHFFAQKIPTMIQLGIKDIIIDPGFGFGKTQAQNFELLKNLPSFSIFEKPLLVGISRKRMIYETLHTSPEQALNGTSVLNTIALTKGASILRVHDVREAKQCIELWKQMNHC